MFKGHAHYLQWFSLGLLAAQSSPASTEYCQSRESHICFLPLWPENCSLLNSFRVYFMEMILYLFSLVWILYIISDINHFVFTAHLYPNPHCLWYDHWRSYCLWFLIPSIELVWLSTVYRLNLVVNAWSLSFVDPYSLLLAPTLPTPERNTFPQHTPFTHTSEGHVITTKPWIYSIYKARSVEGKGG